MTSAEATVAERAQGLIDQGRGPEALALLGPALAEASGGEPHRAAMLHCLAARALLLVGSPGDAEWQARRAVALEPSRAEPLRVLALVALGFDRTDDARQIIQAALALEPGDPLCQSDAVRVEVAAGFDGRAKALARQLQQSSPDHPLTWAASALAALKTNPAGAEVSARRGLELAPDDVELRGLLASALAKQGRTHDFFQEVQAAAAEGGDVRAAATLGRVKRTPDPVLPILLVLGLPSGWWAVRLYAWSAVAATEVLMMWAAGCAGAVAISIATRVELLAVFEAPLRRALILRLVRSGLVGLAVVGVVLVRALAFLSGRGRPMWPVALPAGTVVVVALAVAGITWRGVRRRRARSLAAGAVGAGSVTGQA